MIDVTEISTFAHTVKGHNSMKYHTAEDVTYVEGYTKQMYDDRYKAHFYFSQYYRVDRSTRALYRFARMMCNWASVGRTCAKFLLFILNGLCISIAVCTSVFAIVDIKVLKNYGEGHGSGTVCGDIFILLVCFLLLVVAIFGCIGTAKENAKILCLYVIILMMLMAIEMLVAVYVAVQRYGLEFRIGESLRNDFFRNVTHEEMDQHKKMWDDLQITYECCGLNGADDYQAIRQPVSVSCCPRAHRARTEYAQRQLYQTCLESKSYFSEGCEDEILQEIRSGEDWLIGVTVISSWFQAAEVLAAMWLAQVTKRDAQCKQQGFRS